MKKMTVALDVDGVVADFIGAIAGFLSSAAGMRVDESTFSSTDVFSCLRHPTLNVKELLLEEMSRPGFVSEMKPYDGAIDGFKRLSELADVFFVTDPFKDSQTWGHERTLWLMRTFDVSRDSVVLASDKSRVAGDILIDDSPSNVRQWTKTGRNSLLWSRNYNKVDGVGLQRVKSWQEVIPVVSETSRSIANVEPLTTDH